MHRVQQQKIYSHFSNNPLKSVLILLQTDNNIKCIIAKNK